MHVLHVAAHGSAVRAVVGGTPPAFAAAFVEALSQFVEGEYGLGLSCTVRTLQVRLTTQDVLWEGVERALPVEGRSACAAMGVALAYPLRFLRSRQCLAYMHHNSALSPQPTTSILNLQARCPPVSPTDQHTSPPRIIPTVRSGQVPMLSRHFLTPLPFPHPTSNPATSPPLPHATATLATPGA